MLAIFEKIRRPAADAADLRQRLAEVSETLPQLEAEVRRHGQRRAEGLLALSDREIEKIEAELALAVRNRDRALAAIEELERRHTEAEEAEFVGGFESRIADIEKRAAVFAKSLAAEYDRAAKPLTDLMHRYVDLDAEIRQLNGEVHEAFAQRGALAKRPPNVRTIAERAEIGQPGGTMPGGTLIPPLSELTSIAPGASQHGFGAAANAFAILGLKP
jgi:chromosome segregation ATPase